MRTVQVNPTSRPTLSVVAKQIDEISSFPDVALRVIEVLNDPDSGPPEYKAVLEGDPALTARVLRCVNSSAYPTRHEVTNLQQAITLLGPKQLRNLALTASVSELFRTRGGIQSYSRTGLWRHLVSVGLCARLVAKRLRFANYEDIFLAGMMHDIGIVLEDQYVHPQFCKIMRATEPGKTLIECERKYLLFDHTTLGERVAEAWRFPPVVKSAIRYHHASMQYDESDKLPVRCVELANLLCSLKGITSVGQNLVRPFNAQKAALPLDKDDLVELMRQLEDELEKHQSLFQL